MQPELIGRRYRVESAIGQGGMGTVWLCRDETLHRAVAIKQVGLLPGESVTDSARAFREARSSAGLSHRNVVTVFDVVEDAGHIWLVMEHVPGRSLSEIIKQDGPLPPETVADIGAQVADGLAALHAAGTVHRDVKPGNVLIREDGVAKISDFGIARTAGDPSLTQSGFLTGTPSYFSPALARGAEPGVADDVWALGATLYATVEGHSPYQQQDNPVAVLHDIASGQPQRPRRAEFLEPALLRMMDRDPDSRWSMSDAGHVLRQLAESHRRDSTRESTLHQPRLSPAPAPSPAATPTGPTPQPAPAPTNTSPDTERKPVLASASKGRSSGRVVGALLALLALLLVVGVVVFLSTRPENSQRQDNTAGATPSAEPDPKPSGEPSTPDEASSGGGDATESGSDAAAKEEFVREYFRLAPGGSDQAWEMLGPGLQQQGRASYDRFWRRIESVDVQEVEASADSNTVDVTLVYRTTDGTTSTERKREQLTPTDDGFLLESDVPAG